MRKQKVLFISKDSAVRSRIAAAFLEAYFGDRFEAYYAGMGPSQLNPYAVRVMEEIGIDISSSRTQRIEDLSSAEFDSVITLCDYARANLSGPPRHKIQLHHGFKDFCIPSLCDNAKKFKMCLAEQKKDSRARKCRAEKDEKDLLTEFRCLREAIFYWVEHEAVF